MGEEGSPLRAAETTAAREFEVVDRFNPPRFRLTPASGTAAGATEDEEEEEEEDAEDDRMRTKTRMMMKKRKRPRRKPKQEQVRKLQELLLPLLMMRIADRD